MPYRLVAVDKKTNKVVGAAYWNDSGFLSALAVMPEFRNRRIGKLLIACSLGHMTRDLNVPFENLSLHVLGVDASVERHTLYRSSGFQIGGDEKRGGTYLYGEEAISSIRTEFESDIEKYVMRPTIVFCLIIDNYAY